MLADPSLHVISICSYPDLHKEHAVAAAKGRQTSHHRKATRDVLGRLRGDSACGRCGGCEELRLFRVPIFESSFSRRKSVIDQGLLGTIHYGEVDYYHGIGPWYGQFRWNIRKAAGGSALLTAGCHALDALLLCMGTDVESVTSCATRSRSEVFAPYEYDTTSVTILKFNDGRIGKCAAVVDCLQPYYFHTHLVGSPRQFARQQVSLHETQRLEQTSVERALSMKMLDSGDVSDHPYTTQFQAFFDALDRGEKMPLTSLDDALRSHEIIFAADRAAEKGERGDRVRWK
jgi:predicted dehydrogenase